MNTYHAAFWSMPSDESCNMLFLTLTIHINILIVILDHIVQYSVLYLVKLVKKKAFVMTNYSRLHLNIKFDCTSKGFDCI